MQTEKNRQTCSFDYLYKLNIMAIDISHRPPAVTGWSTTRGPVDLSGWARVSTWLWWRAWPMRWSILKSGRDLPLFASTPSRSAWSSTPQPPPAAETGSSWESKQRKRLPWVEGRQVAIMGDWHKSVLWTVSGACVHQHGAPNEVGFDHE